MICISSINFEKTSGLVNQFTIIPLSPFSYCYNWRVELFRQRNQVFPIRAPGVSQSSSVPDGLQRREARQNPSPWAVIPDPWHSIPSQSGNVLHSRIWFTRFAEHVITCSLPLLASRPLDSFLSLHNVANEFLNTMSSMCHPEIHGTACTGVTRGGCS